MIALVVALAGLVVGLLVWRELKRRAPAFSQDDDGESSADGPTGPPAVIFNPSKRAAENELLALVKEVAAEAGLPEPLWLETTVDDPGGGQVRTALERDASVVIAAGGDGTVRAVAEQLAGTGTPMGILPLGTGNLLARNLDIQRTGYRDMVVTALTGRRRTMDLGWLRIERPPAADTPEEDVYREAPGREAVAPTPAETDRAPEVAAGEVPGAELDQEHVFLVIGGMGFDAEMVSGADDDLKARIGWIAYFVAGVRHLLGRKLRATVELGDAGAGSTGSSCSGAWVRPPRWSAAPTPTSRPAPAGSPPSWPAPGTCWAASCAPPWSWAMPGPATGSRPHDPRGQLRTAPGRGGAV